MIPEESTIIEDDTFIESIEKSQESMKERDTIEIIRDDMLIHPCLDKMNSTSQEGRQDGDMSHMSLVSYSLAI